MKKIVLLLWILSAWTSLHAIDIMRLSEIKPDMTGEGKTIFKGSKIETFQFKVLGILENFAPSKNLIFVEMESPQLAESGVIQGMSGSPLYINNKVIGAVAYSFSFSKKPIAGVTPIEDIIQVAGYNASGPRVEISDIKIDFTQENMRDISRRLREELSARLNYAPQSTLVPIKLIGSSRGFKPEALSLLAPVFTSAQDLTMPGEITRQKFAPDQFTVSPADAVSVPLVRGDYEYSVSGTVTHVDGKNIYLFGHPFYNLGRVDFPLHKAEILTVIPSLDTSFKLAVTRQMVGAVVQDRFSGVLAEMGKTPNMIPLKMFLKNRNRSINLELVNHPLLTPVLTYISLLNVFQSEFQQYGFQTLAVNGKIFIEGEENIVLEDLFAGATAFDDFANLLTAVNYFLITNKERPVKIQKIDFNIETSESVKRAELENVLLSKTAYAPGELIDVHLSFKTEQGSSFEEKTQIKAPNLKPGSSFYLLVADAAEIIEFDSKMIKTDYFPTRLSALIRAINNLRKNNRVYFKLFVPTDGLYVQGFEYSHLPTSLSNVLTFNAAPRDQSPLSFSTISEYQYEVPAMVDGKKLFKIDIKERKNE